jgi:hypothetical protein
MLVTVSSFFIDPTTTIWEAVLVDGQRNGLSLPAGNESRLLEDSAGNIPAEFFFRLLAMLPDFC